MRHHVRKQLIAVATAMLDGARQCPHMAWPSVRRMLAEIGEALPLIGEQSYRPQRDSLARIIAELQKESGHSSRSETLLADLIGELTGLRHSAQEADDLSCTVVFMPYNAAMWDSFHSIWQAAHADPRCRAIVVPIPYVDRNPDGSVAKLHDHTKLLPPEVPVTPHDRFDLARVHPDVVYIQNPYDGFNRVTSVLPDYYTEKLRPHTDLLVYVPYFATDKPMPDHFDEFASFALCDKVIAQSEAFAGHAIELWSSNKVVPLGSPKFDYALDSPGGALSTPQRSAIAGRTVLLQATSLGAFLTGRGDVVAKLDDVLTAVEQHEDLLLWWRPHPLERATFESMLPDLLPAYDRYAARAAASKQVLVDTSMDLQRAIRAAHAFFGHQGSTVTLFGITGKPMLLQNPNAPTEVRRADGDRESFTRQIDVEPENTLSEFAVDEWFAYEGAITYLRYMLGRNGGIVPGQREAFQALAANSDGSAGRHIHEYVTSCL